jgi:hypothetical protein
LLSVGDHGRTGQAPRRNSSRPAGSNTSGRRGAGGQERRLSPSSPPTFTTASRHYAKHVSALLPGDADSRLSRRNARYGGREVLWRESRLKRVRKCGRVPVAGDGYVALKDNAGVCHYAGLATCGSIWACPVCSAKIRNARAEEISAAAARWDRAGNSVYMVTLTMPHDFGMKLAALLPVIADGFRSVISGRRWVKLRTQVRIVGTIRSVEVTHGINGWHPHLHVLVFTTGDPGADGLAQLAAHIRARWTAYIEGQGYRPPDAMHGVVIERCTSAAQAGVYIAKTQDGAGVGNELARADLKQGRNGHRTPFEILESFRWTGDVEDLALWHEYERASKGHQCITWSKGLRSLLAAHERTDEELAAEEVGGDVLMLIPYAGWRKVTGVPGLPAYLLDEAERDGAAAVAAALARFGIEAGPAP